MSQAEETAHAKGLGQECLDMFEELHEQPVWLERSEKGGDFEGERYWRVWV